MGVSAAVMVGGQLIGSYMASQGAEKAASQQQQAAAAAQQTQQQMLQQQLAATQPYRAAGSTALNQLQTGFQPGGQFAQPFTLAQAAMSPAQQAVQQQSMEAMRNQMQLGGQNLSTNAIVGAGTLAGNLAGQFENQAFNQWMAQQQQQIGGLENIAGTGLQATGMATGQMGVAGQNIGSLQVGAGNAQAAGTAGMYNAMAQGITGATGSLAQMNTLSSLLSPNKGINPQGAGTGQIANINNTMAGVMTGLENPPGV